MEYFSKKSLVNSKKIHYLCHDFNIHYKPKPNEMKKVFMLIAMLALPFAMQAQTKFHDAEANEAQGPVKSMTITMMGMTRTITFSEDGKMQSSDLSDAVYDADGYLQSVKMNMQGQSTEVKYLWENGRLVGQVLNVMGTDMKLTHIYDDKGVVTGEKMDMGGQVMEMPYSDIKVDDHGMMGQEMENTRTIEYY